MTRISEQAAIRRLEFTWSGDDLRITRQGELVVELAGVARIGEQASVCEETLQDLLLLKIACADGRTHAFFIDADPVQTNVRAVDPGLEVLEEVLDWLLPQGYVHRQGDVGIYPRSYLPAGARKIDAADYADECVDILSYRHLLEPAVSCNFYCAPGKLCYVLVRDAVRLVHPEHPAIELEPGLYELLGARGVALPQYVGLREGETPLR